MGNGGGVGGTFQPYLDSLRQELQESDRTLLSVVVALLAVLLTLGKEAAGGYGGGRRARVRAWTGLVQTAAAAGEGTWVASRERDSPRIPPCPPA